MAEVENSVQAVAGEMMNSKCSNSVEDAEENLVIIEDESKTITIGNLPPELMLRIFSHYMRTEGPKKFLKNIPPVCRKWKGLSATSSLWDKVSLISLACNIDHLLKLGEMGLLSSTRSLNLDTISSDGSDSDHFKIPFGIRRRLPNPVDIVMIARYCNNLTSLDISCCKISVTAMEYLARKFPNIDRFAMDSATGSTFDYDHGYRYNRDRSLSPRVLDPVFSVWAPKLKHLNVEMLYFSENMELISKVANCCPCLEEFNMLNTRILGPVSYCVYVRCPIGELVRGCPKLRVLKLCFCDFVFRDDEDFVGFRELREFVASCCDFHGLDVTLLLRNSTDLKVLRLYGDYEEIRNIPEIPSETLEHLGTSYRGGPMEYLVLAARKWKRTLKLITIGVPYGKDITCVLEAFLEDNPEPLLEKLYLRDYVMPMLFLKRFIRVCRNLSYLELGREKKNSASISFRNRKEIEEILDLDEPYYNWREGKHASFRAGK